MRRDLARPCAAADLGPPPPRAGRAHAARRRAPRRPRIGRLRPTLRAHPCHGCPDREDHARWAERWLKLDRDTSTLRAGSSSAPTRSPGSSTGSARCSTDLGYLDGGRSPDRPGAALLRSTPSSTWSPRSACERRLGRPRPGRAGRGVSALVFEARRPDDAQRRGCPAAGPRSGRDGRLWADLDALERDHRLDFLREPDLGFAWAAYRWAEGGAGRRARARSTWPRATSCAG